MPHNHHHSSFAAILLAVLMLASTACSTTDQTTITATPDDTTATPGDTTPTPDDAPAPGSDTGTTRTDTPTPTDTTPTPDDGTTSAPTDTPAPDTTSAPDNPTAPANSITEPTISAPSRDQDSEEVASIVFNYPESLLTNDNDSPTPLGRLCWAVQEYMLMEGVLFSQVMEDKNPGYEVVFPDISSTDDDVGPVGSVNEEYPTIGTDDYFSNTLGAIQESAIVATVNDDGLSEELQLFAQAFFTYVAAFNNQLKAGGYENIDQATLPYQNFDDFPHVEEFTEAIEANPDKCKFPTIEEAEKEIAKFDQYVTEN